MKTYRELLDERKRLQQAIEAARAVEVRDVIEGIVSVMRLYNISMRELGRSYLRRPGARGSVARSRGRHGMDGDAGPES